MGSVIVSFLKTAAAASTSIARYVAGLLVLTAGASQAAQFTINGPAGSSRFGTSVTTLPNGNIVVTDPGFTPPGPILSAGAVYLYRPDGTLISTLRGSSEGDQVGSGGVTVLSSGNFAVSSPYVDDGASVDAGAVTFGSGTLGVAGVVSPVNSLVGSSAGQPSSVDVIALRNGNYLVHARSWDNGSATDVGAVTFGSGTHGVTGVVSVGNSLVGGSAGDQIGDGGITLLGNGGYVVISPRWDNGAVTNSGAVTFGSGVAGISGVVSPSNSLVGNRDDDVVGIAGVTVLANDNFVVLSPYWDSDTRTNAGALTFGSGVVGVSGAVSQVNSLTGGSADSGFIEASVTALSNGNYVLCSPNWNDFQSGSFGAATFGSGVTGVSGVVSTANSLVGSGSLDRVCSLGVTALSNGNYVVSSPLWDNGPAINAGAVTFGSGVTGITGVISPSNSLVGTSAADQVGGFGVTALSNGNYVVSSPDWDNGSAADAGAVTFGSGSGGVSGTVSPSNSLVGGTASDRVGYFGVTGLSNGNYVVSSAYWDNGPATNVGAVTFGSGSSGVAGFVSPANSLVGGSASDLVGISGVTALGYGNYVVGSKYWDDGAAVDAGAATFGAGTVGITGLISSSNSLVGANSGDQTGDFVVPLANGNYAVRTLFWNNGPLLDAGAVTFGSGSSGISGVVSAANSLVGASSEDYLGDGGVIALSNGDYVVSSTSWDNGDLVNVGAITVGSGSMGVRGNVSPENSLVGGSAGDFIGVGGVTAFDNAKFVVLSPIWDNGATGNAGAITLGLPDGTVVGPVTDMHSVLGTVANEGASLVFAYDAFRNQLAVGQHSSNRVILHRSGVETTIAIAGDTPDPSAIGQPVNFTAILTASSGLPNDGRVTFTASSGESCVDTSPTSISPTTVAFSCSLIFTTAGVTTVAAEYTGSIVHAYSRSAPETHTTIVDTLFANGFESP
jgi:hypothetical protein